MNKGTKQEKKKPMNSDEKLKYEIASDLGLLEKLTTAVGNL